MSQHDFNYPVSIPESAADKIPDSNWSVLPTKLPTTFYVASRTLHSSFWVHLSNRFPIRASWIYEAGPGQTKSMAELWKRIEDEVRTSYALFLYVCIDDVQLKGAFVEAGMALAMGKPVYVFAQSMSREQIRADVGSWVSHPLVTVLESNLSMEEALSLVKPTRTI